jgi:hypothetical protein
VPKIAEHAKVGEEEAERSEKEGKSLRFEGKKLCGWKVHLNDSPLLRDFLCSRRGEKFIPSMWILTKLTYLLLQNRLTWLPKTFFLLFTRPIPHPDCVTVGKRSRKKRNQNSICRG